MTDEQQTNPRVRTHTHSHTVIVCVQAAPEQRCVSLFCVTEALDGPVVGGVLDILGPGW